MGDRNNPIKFGPEWLRNMPRERSAARSTTNIQNTNSGPTTTSVGSSGASGGAATNIGGSTTTNNSSGTSKILLAKLRYGREEMLALYDRNAEAPPELKVIDTLYQPRGKQPVALNSTFDDDMRESIRSVPSIGGMSSADRFGISRGAGRGSISDGRGRTRGSSPRFTSLTGRGAHYMPKVGGPRMAYSGGDDDGGTTRPWSNNVLNTTSRNSGDQADWASKMYRSKRQGTNTNWRQPQTRDEGEEWRSSEPGRSRPLEKWDRDWGDRPSGEKPQSWSTNRRTWVGGDSQNEENLPEWAGENAECGGTFDSSGAFHGYSNDDTNIPKHQDSSYSLTRSHTHGSFPRSKTVEEGSDEWWASEKAKKLSPKRFETSDLKFKKQSGIIMTDVGNSTPSTNSKSNTSKEDASQEVNEKRETSATAPEPPECNNTPQAEEKYSNQNLFKSKFVESKTFDAMMRSDINMEDASDERGNFQSVIITPNNSLRQKHQHMVMAADGQKHIRISLKGNSKSEMDHGTLKSSEDMLVDNIFGMSIDDDEILSTTLSNPGISSEMATGGSGLSKNPNQNIQMSMSNSALTGLSGRTMDMHVNKQNMQASGLPSGHPMSGMQPNILTSPGLQKVSGVQMQPGGHMQTSGMPSGPMQSSVMSNPAMASVGLQNPGGMQNSGHQSSGMQAPRVQTPSMQSVMQPVGMTNSALNASLGLPMVPGGNIATQLQGVPQQMPNVCMANNMGASGMGVMGSSSMQGPGNMSSYHSSSGLQGMSSNNVGNNSLFLGKNSNNPSMSTANEMPMSNHVGQSNMFPLHNLQHSGSQASFGNSIYSNNQNLADQWYYEDPERNIQGPFPSKDMYNWYRAGFFSASLMVRRACETSMRPLGSYGPVVPFTQLDMIPGFPMSSGFESRTQGNHENMLNSQPSLGLDVMNIGNMNRSDNTSMDSLQFGSVGRMPNQSFGQQQQRVDSLWGQPSTSSDLMWMQQPLPSRTEARVNNLPLYFWEQQPSAITSKSLLPEDITKEMKTEDQILAQLRATQPLNQSGLQYMSEPQPPVPSSVAKTTEESYLPLQNATPNMEELQKLIQKDTLTGGNTATTEPENDSQVEKAAKLDQSSSESSVIKQSQNKCPVETKPTKPAKETEKTVKNKEINNTKNKTKKSKEEKKEEVEVKTKEEEVIKAEKRSQEPSPAKSKKDEKSKKELEREKKEWLKEGFTIVKGTEKNVSKDNKKKAEEIRVAEEAERKKKEDEKLAAEEDKKKKLAESARKLQEQQLQQQRQAAETVMKKAPWSAVATQAMQSTTRDGPTLAEIQRLEREKKLEQMKEQQQMMQIIAQQQAAAIAREQEMQAGLGWAKKKNNNANVPGQSLAEIQAEARKQAAAAAAAAAAQALEEAQAVAAAAPPLINHVPWANAVNGGFWETQLEQQKLATGKQDTSKVEQSKPKKKPTLVMPAKKETSPAVEFDNWCSSMLSSWSTKIDVPTFVGFLKDIESPYEVKDYVKCYLGESKDSGDFSRQFLERRSKLLRVGMVTPSDDLCSPAIAVNPRTISGSDFQEVKGKGKKTKKNKMFKVDARILGFSVTASEDRINVGDIDTV